MGEAQRHYEAARAHCAPFGWPTEATFPDYSSASSSDSRPEAEAAQVDLEGGEDDRDRRAHFDQGPFLRMLISRIRALPDQVTLLAMFVYIFTPHSIFSCFINSFIVSCDDIWC